MTRKYDFVTKLMSGTVEASAKMRWWPRHSRAMARYIEMAAEKDTAVRKSVRELLMRGATEWEACVCRPSNPLLMTEHAALEIAFVDAWARGETVVLEQTAQRMTANAKAQTEFYAAKVPGFPAPRWYAAMLEHVKLFTESIRHLESKDGRKWNECEKRREDNTLALAEVTTEWL